ncbi:hypothetical protein SH611_09670 (plasmid) [Geminicoccaceae bacterium 1502E]|nr:hypothetical protein [Geminicoccaceae bacterium 1502E]
MLTGATRGRHAAALAAHLLRGDTNAEVEVLEPRHLAAEDLPGQLAELLAGAAHGRTARPLYHVHANPDPAVRPPTPSEMEDFWCRLEAELGLAQQPYVAVAHVKHGRRHEHRVYALVRPDGATIDLGHDYARREKVARCWEFDHALSWSPGCHERAVLRALETERPDVHAALLDAGYGLGGRPVGSLTPRERAIEERTGVSLSGLRAQALEVWRHSDDGRSFEAGLATQGLRLAQGDRAPVLVDGTGTAHRLAGLLSGAARTAGRAPIRAAEVRARVADLRLPSLEEARRAIRLSGQPALAVVAAARMSVSHEWDKAAAENCGAGASPAAGSGSAARDDSLRRQHGLRRVEAQIAGLTAEALELRDRVRHARRALGDADAAIEIRRCKARRAEIVPELLRLAELESRLRQGHPLPGPTSLDDSPPLAAAAADGSEHATATPHGTRPMAAETPPRELSGSASPSTVCRRSPSLVSSSTPMP